MLCKFIHSSINTRPFLSIRFINSLFKYTFYSVIFSLHILALFIDYTIKMFVKFNKLLNLLFLSISLCYFANARKLTVMKTCHMYCTDGCCWKGSFRSTAFHIICSLNRYVHYLPNPREDPTMQIGQLNNRVRTEAHTCIICTWTNQNMLRQLTSNLFSLTRMVIFAVPQIDTHVTFLYYVQIRCSVKQFKDNIISLLLEVA